MSAVRTTLNDVIKRINITIRHLHLRTAPPFGNDTYKILKLLTMFGCSINCVIERFYL